ncbi:MAG TPA: DUF1566 domain-containing protein, partial [Xanthomonadaceae bacterium]|nr:DUF1566 domain-containing protein [Xanthomonadaceae bacterium]
MRYFITIVLIVASSLSCGAAHAVVVTRRDIEEMVSELVASPGDGDVNQLASRICGIQVAELRAPGPVGEQAKITVQSMLPIFPAEGSATVRLVGVGGSDLTGRAITGPCEGTLKFKYRFSESWNGVSMVVDREFTEGPTLVGPDGTPVAAPAPKSGSSTGTLVIDPDASCDLRVDGVFTHTVAPHESFKVEAMPGERLIACDSIKVTGVRASERRKVEAGAKVAVELSLEALEKASLATAKLVPQTQDVKAARSPGAMIDRGDGVLEQVSSGMLWTQRDNASDVTWGGARQYCDALRTSGGGWRLPSEAEFRSLYIDTAGVAKAIPCGDHTCSASPLKLSNWWFWTSERSDSRMAWIFTLSDDYGRTSSYPIGASSGSRALCVRTPRAEEADTAQARARVASEAASRSPVVEGKEIDRGGGVLEQVSSGLLWTARDNGADISWDSARRYCEKLSLAGGGWRLPSSRDLVNLFMDAVGTKAVACGVGFCGVPSGFSFTSFQLWAVDADASGKGRFMNFEQGLPGSAPAGYSYHS